MSDCAPLTDPFDPAKLRLKQDFATELGVKKILMTVPVRKPDKTWFVRVQLRALPRLSKRANERFLQQTEEAQPDQGSHDEDRDLRDFVRSCPQR